MPDREHWLETGRLAELGLLSAELVHELRQPIFAAKALAQLLHRDAEVGSSAHDRLATLLGQLEYVETILARHAGGGRPAADASIPVLLGPPIEAGVALLRHRARTSQKTLTVEVEGEGGLVRADPTALQQVASNLVQNALDAARDTVQVRVANGVVVVVDDGPGVADAVSERLFEPFVTTKAPGRGTGLGLPITRHLVERYGGAIRYESSPAGTTFQVTFPTVQETS